MVDVNQLLHVYLDADQSGGYRPGVDGEEQLRKAFPNEDTEELLKLLRPYLDEWNSNLFDNLAVAANEFEISLHTKFPELNEHIIRTLANRWAYSNR